jgi:gas vesicle protein
MSKNNNRGKFLAGMLIGGAFGTVVGILIAPRSGRETRRILKKSADALPELAEDLSTMVQLHADHLSESALHQWQETLIRLKAAIAAGIEASQLEAQETENPPDLTGNPYSPENSQEAR